MSLYCKNRFTTYSVTFIFTFFTFIFTQKATFTANLSAMIHALFTTMPMFVCLFWTVVLFLQYKVADRARRMLFIFMLTATVLYSAHCVFFNRSYTLVPLTDSLYSFANLAVYPLYLLYISTLTKSKRLSLLNYSILLPSLLIGMAIGICYLVMSGPEVSDFVTGYLYSGNSSGMAGVEKVQVLLHQLVKLVFAIQVIPVLYIATRDIAAYDKLVRSYYSYTDNKSLYRVRNLLFFFTIAAIASFILNIVGRTWFANSDNMVIIPSLFFSVLLFTIGHLGTKIEFTADELSDVPSNVSKIAENDVKNIEEWKQKIIEIMESRQLYLRPNLKISDLTQMMSTNRNYIYNAINIGMGISFSEFVNRYRVTHAQQLINNSDNIDINAVWKQSGFSSETSFYRNFKLYAGCTPQQWKSDD